MLYTVYHKKKQKQKHNNNNLIYDGKCFWNTFETHQFACNYLVY